MSWYQIIFISILITISGCQPLTKTNNLSQGSDQAILREINNINMDIVDKIPQIPRDLPIPTP